ncbi:SLBB domain protein, partial [Vibrio parahaemolyticus V-223/04]
LATRALSKFA